VSEIDLKVCNVAGCSNRADWAPVVDITINVLPMPHQILLLLPFCDACCDREDVANTITKIAGEKAIGDLHAAHPDVIKEEVTYTMDFEIKFISLTDMVGEFTEPAKA
jgi:hypothetical protein